ncbi:prion-inhibition and propagation-domain-containing protein [Cladorrhinum sp. PSN332]|nr:prion-inhibition and propagation-domain-containing protein [Cladorrhinum sp. PSN332]
MPYLCPDCDEKFETVELRDDHYRKKCPDLDNQAVGFPFPNTDTKTEAERFKRRNTGARVQVLDWYCPNQGCEYRMPGADAGPGWSPKTKDGSNRIAVGVIALAGVFKDIIDLYSLFSASKELRQDHHILETKLSSEKAVLLEWASSVRLLSPDYDRRLDNPGLPVGKILISIRRLLSDASDLEKKYGLSEASTHDAPGEALALRPLNTQVLTQRFVTEFAKFQIRGHQDGKVSSGARLRWVIKDKQKFINLIDDLVYFNNKLRELVSIRVPAVFIEAGEQWKQTQKSDTEIVRRVLKRLWFRTITERQDSIHPSHAGTFRWALETPSSATSRWDDLARWLETGTGIYWVCGKAGSGKSTLMKYLHSSDRTKLLLRSWGGGDVLTGSHFFWYLGTSEQKTQDGLQRSVLYQLLTNNNELELPHPTLVRKALPGMWKEEQEGEYDKEIGLPSRSEVERAVRTLGESDNARNVCLFIDGLDEYSGDFKQGIRFISFLATFKHIKVIVSSRPIPECVSAFSQQPHLMLQDLTRGNIKLFVDQELRDNSDMKRLSRGHPEETASILDDIASKADGVFLWVVLATRLLKEGLADGDHIGELRQLVEALPEELGEMFERMLGRRKPRHKEQGAKILKICYESALAGGAHESSLLGFPTIGLARLDESLISIQNYASSTDPSADFLKLKQLDSRLRSRTGGLVELVDRLHALNFLGDSRDWRTSHLSCVDDVKIQFMHRTVFEYLKTGGVWGTDCLRICDARFNVWAALSLCHLVQAILDFHIGSVFAKSLRSGLRWGLKADFLRRNRDNGLRVDYSSQHGPDIFTDLNHLIHLCRTHKAALGGELASFFEEHGHFDSLHTSLILAAELGAEEFLQRHPNIVAELQEIVPRCGCRNIRYYADQKPFNALDFSNVKKPERKGSLQERDMKGMWGSMLRADPSFDHFEVSYM